MNIGCVGEMAEGFRRVITGRRADGRSVVVSDDRVGFGALRAVAE